MPVARWCIAVVDDETPVRMALGRLLRLADYDVNEFSSGEAFLVSLHAGLPDLVVLDVHMPGLSGFCVQSRLLAEHLDVPAMFITASDDPGLDLAVTEAGGVQLLRKPFFSQALLDALSAALHSKRTTRHDAACPDDPD